MRIDDPNLPHLRIVAEALADLGEPVVFVGGAVVGLLLTDPLAQSVRSTKDVDIVIDAGVGAFHRVEEKIADRGFSRDSGADIICRWFHRASGVLVDVMPIDPRVLGFSNRWYRYAIDTAHSVDLGNGLSIKLASAVAFVAMKLEAFASRGAGNVLASHDLEDILNIVDGREELLEEFAAAPEALRQTAGRAIAMLLTDVDFINGLPGMLTEQERAELVRGRLEGLAALRLR